MAQPVSDRIEVLNELQRRLHEHELDVRPASPEDHEFELALSAERFQGAIAEAMSTEQAAALIRQQFEMQQNAYCRQFPESLRLVVAKSGHLVARCWLNLAASELRIVDVAVAQAWQQQRIGSHLVRAVCDMAAIMGVPVRLTVAVGNTAAARLYLSNGFARSGGTGPMIEMEACP